MYSVGDDDGVVCVCVYNKNVCDNIVILLL